MDGQTQFIRQTIRERISRDEITLLRRLLHDDHSEAIDVAVVVLTYRAGDWLFERVPEWDARPIDLLLDGRDQIVITRLWLIHFGPPPTRRTDFSICRATPA